MSELHAEQSALHPDDPREVCAQMCESLRDGFLLFEGAGTRHTRVAEARVRGMEDCAAAIRALPPFAAHQPSEAVKRLVEIVRDIVSNSRGVDGWHRNGDVAEWDEFDIDTALAAVEKEMGQ